MSGWSKPRIELKFAEGSQWRGHAPTQEDYFEVNPERGIFILADGFGGEVGARAAELVVKSVRHFLEQEAGDLDATLPFEIRPYYSLAGNVLFNAISYANQKLLAMNVGKSQQDSGGTSLIAGYLEGRLLSIAQVGACKLHLKRQDRVKEIVAPKSLLRQVDPMSDDGEGSNVPLLSFGTAKSLEPEMVEVEVRAGDQFLFQTSGVKTGLRTEILDINAPHELSQIIDSNAIESNASVVWLGF